MSSLFFDTPHAAFVLFVARMRPKRDLSAAYTGSEWSAQGYSRWLVGV